MADRHGSSKYSESIAGVRYWIFGEIIAKMISYGSYPDSRHEKLVNLLSDKISIIYCIFLELFTGYLVK